MKLSKAQAEVLEQAHKDIDKARSMDYPEWLMATNHYYQIPEWAMDETSQHYNPELVERLREKFAEAVEREELKDYWQRERNGIVLTHCNSKTIKNLKNMGWLKSYTIQTVNHMELIRCKY